MKVTVIKNIDHDYSDKARKAIRMAVRDVSEYCHGKIKANSPKRSGALSRSWVMDQIGALQHKVATSIKYARWVNDGTGIYGSGRPITPKRAKYLRFTIGGRVIFARSVRGQKGQKYVEKTVAQTEAAAKRIVGSALRKAGL